MTSPTIPQSLQPPARQPTVREQKIVQQYGSVESYQQAVAGTEIEKRISKVVSDINTGKITSESQIPSDLKQFIDVGDYFQKVTEYKAKLESYNESIRRQAEAKQVENFIRRGKEGEIARGGTPYQRQLLRDAKQRQAILSEYYQEPIPLSPWTKFYDGQPTPTTTTPSSVVVSGFDYFGRPEYQSVAPSLQTGKQKFDTKVASLFSGDKRMSVAPTKESWFTEFNKGWDKKGVVKATIKDVKETARDLYETRIPVIGKSMYELTQDTTQAEVIMIDGEKVLVDRDRSREEMPETFSSISKTTVPETAHFLSGRLGIESLKKYNLIFGGSEESVEKPTAREFTASISKGYMESFGAAFDMASLIYGTVAPEGGITTRVPEKTIPQKVTISGELKFEPYDLKVFTPEDVQEIGGIAGTIIPYSVTNPFLLLGGGVSILTGPSSVVTPEERVEGVFMTAFGGVGSIGKGYKFFKEPIVKKVPGKPDTDFVSVTQPYTKGEESISDIGFLVKRETPMTKETTTAWKKLLGKKPKVEELPPSIHYTWSPFPLKGKGSRVVGYFETAKGGKDIKSFTFNKYIGESSGPADLVDVYPTLSLKEKAELYKLAMKKTGGRPVPEKYVPQILGKDYIYTSGYSVSQRIARVRIEKKRVPIKETKIKKFGPKTFEKYPSLSKYIYGTDTEGFYVRGKIGTKILKKPRFFEKDYKLVKSPLKVDTIYIRKGSPESTLIHEKGHAYIKQTDYIERLTTSEKKKLFKEAEQDLIKRYGENIPYPKDRYIDEYLATKLGGRKTTSYPIINIRTPTPGKTITASESFSIFKEVPTPETLPYKIYKSKMTVRDTTKPFSRKESEMIKGTSYVYETIDLTPPESYTIPRLISLTKQEVRQQVGMAQQVQTKAIEALPRIRTTIVKSKVDASEFAPTYVGGAGKGVSEYAYTKQKIFSAPNIIEDSSYVLGGQDISSRGKEGLKIGGGLLSGEEQIQTRTIIPLDTTTQTVNLFEGISEDLKSSQALSLESAQKQKSIQKQKQEEATAFGIAVSPAQTDKAIGSTKIESFIPFAFPGEKAYRKGELTGYETMVREKRKYTKVSTKPMTRKGALSLGARYADNTTAATFKIVPITKTVVRKGKKVQEIKLYKEEDLQKGNGFFGSVQHKFREFMVRQGQPKQLKNTYIERGKYRIDTPGEKKGLSVAKYKRQRARETFGVVSKPKSRRQTATVISRRPARKRGVPFRL